MFFLVTLECWASRFWPYESDRDVYLHEAKLVVPAIYWTCLHIPFELGMTLVVSFVIIYLLSRLAATGSATARIIGNAIVSTASLAAASPEERMNEARQLAMKKPRPVLEPRLKEWGLEFEDVKSALERVTESGRAQSCILLI